MPRYSIFTCQAQGISKKKVIGKYTVAIDLRNIPKTEREKYNMILSLLSMKLRIRKKTENMKRMPEELAIPVEVRLVGVLVRACSE